MMTFEWRQLDTSIHDDRPIWGLYLTNHKEFVSLLGTMTKLNRAWRVSERKIYTKPDQYWLDKHLTLDEAQSAAKLFLCVGRQ